MSTSIQLPREAFDAYGDLSVIYCANFGRRSFIEASKANAGTFTRLVVSRQGLVRICSNPKDLVASFERREGGILVEVAEGFKRSDWILVEEDQTFCTDPGWTFHLLTGTLPKGLGSTYDLSREVGIVAGQFSEPLPAPYDEYQLLKLRR